MTYDEALAKQPKLKLKSTCRVKSNAVDADVVTTTFSSSECGFVGVGGARCVGGMEAMEWGGTDGRGWK